MVHVIDRIERATITALQYLIGLIGAAILIVGTAAGIDQAIANHGPKVGPAISSSSCNDMSFNPCADIDTSRIRDLRTPDRNA